MLTAEAASRKDRISGLSPMEHRHFATIAAIIRTLDIGGDKFEVVEHFAKQLAHTNARFDRARFLKACEE